LRGAQNFFFIFLGPPIGFYQGVKSYCSGNNGPIRIKSSSYEPIGNKKGCFLILQVFHLSRV
jgi:hypothetical protein